MSSRFTVESSASVKRPAARPRGRRRRQGEVLRGGVAEHVPDFVQVVRNHGGGEAEAQAGCAHPRDGCCLTATNRRRGVVRHIVAAKRVHLQVQMGEAGPTQVPGQGSSRPRRRPLEASVTSIPSAADPPRRISSRLGCSVGSPPEA